MVPFCMMQRSTTFSTSSIRRSSARYLALMRPFPVLASVLRFLPAVDELPLRVPEPRLAMVVHRASDLRLADKLSCRCLSGSGGRGFGVLPPLPAVGARAIL